MKYNKPMSSNLFFKSPKFGTMVFSSEDAAKTPVGRDARLMFAIRESIGVALARMSEWRDEVQRDLAQEEGTGQPRPQPVILVCAADSGLGGRIIETLSPGMSKSVCGPVVYLRQADEVARMWASAASTVLADFAALGAKHGEVIWAFAVNGSQLDLRVMHAAPGSDEPCDENDPASRP